MLPKNLQYGTKVESAPARSYRSNIAPQNGTGPYNLGETIILNIPTRANLCLATSESYLKFNHIYTNTSGAASDARWDSCGAHGLIQRLKVYHGSNLLQDIDNYGLLAKFLFDLQVPADASYGKLNILSGTRNDLKLTASTGIGSVVGTYVTTATPTGAEVNTIMNQCKVMQVNSGDAITPITLANNTSVTNIFCLNLISLIGSLCTQNYLPLFACTSSSLRVEIQLTSNCMNSFAVTSNTGTSVLTNVEYIGNFIELSDSAMSIIQSSLQGGPLQFVVPDYRNFQTTYNLAAALTQVNFAIPAKFSSLKSIFVMARDKLTGTATFFPYSCVKLGLIDYYFRIGSTLMPAKAPNTVPEFFSELLKSIGSMSDLNYQPSIELTSYSTDSSTANTTYGQTTSGSFYIGLDLENYVNAPKDQIFAGYNSNTDDIYCVLDYAAQGAAITIRFDAFALFDEVIVFNNNTAFIKF